MRRQLFWWAGEAEMKQLHLGFLPRLHFSDWVWYHASTVGYEKQSTSVSLKELAASCCWMQWIMKHKRAILQLCTCTCGWIRLTDFINADLINVDNFDVDTINVDTSTLIGGIFAVNSTALISNDHLIENCCQNCQIIVPETPELSIYFELQTLLR